MVNNTSCTNTNQSNPSVTAEGYKDVLEFFKGVKSSPFHVKTLAMNHTLMYFLERDKF